MTIVLNICHEPPRPGEPVVNCIGDVVYMTEPRPGQVLVESEVHAGKEERQNLDVDVLTAKLVATVNEHMALIQMKTGLKTSGMEVM